MKVPVVWNLQLCKVPQELLFSLVIAAKSPESIEDVVQVIDDFEIEGQQSLGILSLLKVLSKVGLHHDANGEPHHCLVEIDFVPDLTVLDEVPHDELGLVKDLATSAVSERLREKLEPTPPKFSIQKLTGFVGDERLGELKQGFVSVKQLLGDLEILLVRQTDGEHVFVPETCDRTKPRVKIS